MDKLTVKAFAKVNLSLDIVGKREDGYHFVDMILHSVDIFDVLRFEKIQGKGIFIECDNKDIDLDKRNIIYRATESFFAVTNSDYGVKIFLEKNIPMQAGMGGASADAAATLLALNRVFDAGLSLDFLKKIGLSLGADVPFCLEGGCVRAKGIGEIMTKLSPIKAKLLVVKPDEGISTSKAYQAVNLDNLRDRPDNEAMVLAINSHDIEAMGSFMGNVFYSISSSMVEDIRYVTMTMSQQEGCIKAMMSGSGSTVFGIFRDEASLLLARDVFDKEGFQVFCTNSVDVGVLEEVL